MAHRCLSRPAGATASAGIVESAHALDAPAAAVRRCTVVGVATATTTGSGTSVRAAVGAAAVGRAPAASRRTGARCSSGGSAALTGAGVGLLYEARAQIVELLRALVEVDAAIPRRALLELGGDLARVARRLRRPSTQADLRNLAIAERLAVADDLRQLRMAAQLLLAVGDARGEEAGDDPPIVGLFRPVATAPWEEGQEQQGREGPLRGHC